MGSELYSNRKEVPKVIIIGQNNRFPRHVDVSYTKRIKLTSEIFTTYKCVVAQRLEIG
jgi:hypothetical protein